MIQKDKQDGRTTTQCFEALLVNMYQMELATVKRLRDSLSNNYWANPEYINTCLNVLMAKNPTYCVNPVPVIIKHVQDSPSMCNR